MKVTVSGAEDAKSLEDVIRILQDYNTRDLPNLEVSVSYYTGDKAPYRVYLAWTEEK